MKLIDFIYFIAYKAYIRGNKEENGAFFITSLWFSVYQAMWFYIIFSLIEIYREARVVQDIKESLIIAILGSFFIIINNIYIHFGDRKSKIINCFQISNEKEKIYWYLYSISIFVVFGLTAYMSYIKKEMFGW